MSYKLLSVETMLELEEWVAQNRVETDGDCLSEKSLAEQLQLKVEYVPHRDMDRNVEAELRPSADPSYLGIICINEKFRSELFSFMHEILHYLYDVGRGNRVEQVFTRKVRGQTENEHEQHINYLAASYSMPYPNVEAAIREYDAGWPRTDELKFVDDLCRKYHQGTVTVIRRIKEVRKISKARKAAQ